jgi:hypothetical protein
LRPSSLFRLLPCCGADRIRPRFYFADLPWNRDPRARSPSFLARLVKPAATARGPGGAVPPLPWTGRSSFCRVDRVCATPSRRSPLSSGRLLFPLTEPPWG